MNGGVGGGLVDLFCFAQVCALGRIWWSVLPRGTFLQEALLACVESVSDNHSRTRLLSDAGARPHVLHSGIWSNAHGQISA